MIGFVYCLIYNNTNNILINIYLINIYHHIYDKKFELHESILTIAFRISFAKFAFLKHIIFPPLLFCESV